MSLVRRFSSLSIRFKLLLVSLLSGTLPLLLMTITLFHYESQNSSEMTRQRLLAQASIVAANSRTALAFTDALAGRQTLLALASDEEIVFAALYQSGVDRPLAIYRKEGRPWREDESMTERVSVMLEGERIGEVVVSANPRRVEDLTRDYASILMIVFLTGFLLTLLLSTRLQRIISLPLSRLTETARHITETGNYNVQIEKLWDDEIGHLTEIFNSMVVKIREDNEELSLHRTHLEELVLNQTRDLVRARDEAESASRAKSTFLANMSHEIRTPLNAIMGFGRLALQQADGQQRDFLYRIEDAGESLLRIINDILDFSKIEANRMTIERIPFDLHQKVDQICQLHALQAADRKIELILSIPAAVPARVIGDPTRFGQILNNLVSNAIKFTEKGSVVVSVGVVEPATGRATLSIGVEDSGIGLSEEQIGHIFQPFVQADTSTTRRYGGTGLGLVICRRLVELMGGAIHVHSEPGKGSRFTIILPFDLDCELEDPQVGIDADLRDQSVLVVDDNPLALDVVNNLLNDLQLRPHCVATPQAAIERLQQSELENGEPYRVVLLDWSEEQPFGQLLELLASLPGERPALIVMVTGKQREDVAELLSGYRPEVIIAKPLNLSQLNDALMVAFGRRSAQALRGHGWQPDPIELAALYGVRVLLVEDIPVNQHLAQEILHRWGMDVDVAQEGREALRLLRGQQYDLVLMDIQMPGMDGYEATQLIRGQLELTDLPVIAMTAHAMSGDRERFMAAGMDDYVSKPIDMQQLFTAISRVLAGRATVLTDRRSRPEVNLGWQGDRMDNQQTAETPFVLAGIDVEQGLERALNDPDLYQQLLQSFMNSYQDAASSLVRLMERDESGQALRLAHSVKGSAGNIGAMALHQAAARLESALHDAKPWRPYLSQVVSELERVLESLAKATNSATIECDNNADLPDHQLACNAIEELNQLLTEGRFDTTNAMDRLKKGLSGTAEYHTIVSEIGGMLTRFDYPQATRLLTQLSAGLGCDNNRRVN